MAEIAVVGSLNMDLSIQVPRIPSPGETISGGNLLTNAGGKGANQAIACACLGKKVAMVGCVGNDDFGRSLKNGLNTKGVDTRSIAESSSAPTGTAMIMVDGKGENCIVLSIGANRLVNIDTTAEESIRRAKILLLQLEIPVNVVVNAIEIANRWNVPVLLNPAPAIPIPVQILSKVDYLVPNETEAALLTDIQIKDNSTAEKAAGVLLAKGAKTVIITRGADGALMMDANETMHIPAFTVNAVDTTGAGDAFIGGLATAIIEGKDRKTTLEFASAAGALASTKPGAQVSLPCRHEVDAFIKNQN
jgi:ribokinase